MARGIISKMMGVHLVQIRLDIGRMWLKSDGNELEFTDVLTKAFRVCLPMNKDDIVSETEVQTKQIRGEIRDNFIKDTYAIIEHKCAWLGASFMRGKAEAKISGENKGENEARARLLNYEAEDEATSNIQPSLIVSAEDLLSYQILRCSVVQMRSKIREVGDKSINSYIEFIRRFDDVSQQNGIKYTMISSESESTRVSAVSIIIAAAMHANRGIHFSEAIRCQRSHLPQGIFRISCHYDTEKGKVTSSPSCDEVNLANATILENVKDITNTSMRDVDEILGTAVEMATVGIKGDDFRTRKLQTYMLKPKLSPKA